MARIQVDIQGTNFPVSFSVKERRVDGTLGDERFVSYDSQDGFINFTSAGPGIRDYVINLEFGAPGSGIVTFTTFQYDDAPVPVAPLPLPTPIPIPIPQPIPTPVQAPVNYCKDGPFLFGSNPIRVIDDGSLSFQFHGVDVFDITWEIRSNGSIIRSGNVNPTSNVCVINYSALAVGRYELFIKGLSCESEWSSSPFYIAGSGVSPVPVPSFSPVPLPIQVPVPVQPISGRILGVGYLHFISPENFYQLIDDHIARGFNMIYINNVPMDHYFLTWTDFMANNEFVLDNPFLVNYYSGKAWDNWLLPILTYVRNNHPTIPVMFKHLANMGIWPAFQNDPEHSGKDPWWGEGDSVTDQFGLIANSQGSGIRRTPSFASTTARTRIAAFANWMNNKVQSVLNPGQLRWISYGTANTVELGFSQNATSFNNTGDELSATRFFHGDYSSSAVLSFRQYLLDKYGTIEAVNAAHGGPDWGSINDVTPPVSSSAPQPSLVPSDNASWWYEVYQGQRGQDWAQARIRDIVRFIQALPIPSGVERILEPGHFAYAFSHMTMGGAPKALTQRLGKMKVASAAGDILGNKDVHSDMYSSHLQQESWVELAIFDARRYATNYGTTVASVVDAYVRRQEDVGGGFYLQITAPNEANYNDMLNYWNTTRANIFKSGAVTPVRDMSNWPQITVTFEEWTTIQDIILTRWLAVGGSNSNPVNINFIEPQIVGI